MSGKMIQLNPNYLKVSASQREKNKNNVIKNISETTDYKL